MTENCSLGVLCEDFPELLRENGASTDFVMRRCLPKTSVSTSSGYLFSVEHDAHLWLLERSDATLVMRWLQQGKCRNAEQRWRLVAAVQSGTCAISGAADQARGCRLPARLKTVGQQRTGRDPRRGAVAVGQ